MTANDKVYAEAFINLRKEVGSLHNIDDNLCYKCDHETLKKVIGIVDKYLDLLKIRSYKDDYFFLDEI